MIARSLIASFILLLALLSSTSCDSPNKLNATGLIATGKVGEIVVVAEKGLWESEVRNYLDTGLTRFIMPYMPDVVTFELVHRVPGRFEHGIKRHRNVLFLKIDPKHTGDQAKIEKRMDVWAKDQLVIDIIAKDYNQLLSVCKGGLTAVHDEFDTNEWTRIMHRFQKVGVSYARDEVKKNFGITVAMPRGAKIVTKRNNFYRIEFPDDARPIEFVGAGTDAGTIMTGLMVYHYDFVDSTQLLPENLLMARDTMLKYNVPSEVEGMYMGTQYADMVKPEWSTMKTADGKITGTEIRGMFVFTGLPKFGTGGGFWEYHFVNEKTNKVVCVSGYVDAPPTTSWTHYIREIEAILKSVKID